ncbi:hypothetical protein GCM10007989_07390 [Devosia pacifica]|uniref:Uncharacterized protein n=1 Tax=Devosia pacifica TaxID=1335967 RepID=A0A918RXR8_9HYPH|nr:hypothetical protein [Devosia pacifica]GHA15155.1 hypothetical protein GCM10007989_07390 [Devosia pacifica]
MTREAILAEIKRLETERDQSPGMEKAYNDRITALCDRLKGRKAWKPRKVV